MLNNKGQAFSVFELMIAGVVAFAILIILLSVISGVMFSTNNDPLNAIGTTLKTVAPSGQTLTDKFQVKSGVTVRATNFATKTDLDASSIMFFKGMFEDNDLLKVDVSDGSNGTKVSYMSWTGSTALTARAQVICGATAAEAVSALELLDSSFNVNASDLGNYCGDAKPCCAIVLDKP
ncbi:MAG: hypothetical protein WCI04_00880 [archaeon]